MMLAYLLREPITIQIQSFGLRVVAQYSLASKTRR